MDYSEQSSDTDQNATFRGISNKAISKIMQDKDVDVDLLDILKRRIVVASPVKDAVEQATNDITQLASKRVQS